MRLRPIYLIGHSFIDAVRCNNGHLWFYFLKILCVAVKIVCLFCFFFSNDMFVPLDTWYVTGLSSLSACCWNEVLKPNKESNEAAGNMFTWFL
jgi:hypothetical protein